MIDRLWMGLFNGMPDKSYDQTLKMVEQCLKMIVHSPTINYNVQKQPFYCEFIMGIYLY